MRVLTVSIAFPPKNDPEALQTGKYIKYLSRKCKIDVITSSNPTLWMEQDEELAIFNKDVEQIVELPIFEPKYPSIAVNKFFRNYLKPDSRSSFHKKWKKGADKLNQKPDLIYSRSFPLSSTIMAKKLQAHYNVPWVLHLSDPWVESPLFDFKSNPYHQQQESASFEIASLIAFTSAKVVELYKQKYPQFSQKMIYCPNVYDMDDVSEKQLENDRSSLKFAYTGSLNGSRSLETLIKGIKKLPSTLQQKIKITVAGSIDSYNQEIIDSAPNLVDFVGFLSFSKVKKLQAESDVLLAIDFDLKNPKDALFFPSKLLDYFAIQKPILAITTRGSTSDEILTKENHSVAYHHNEEAITSFINDYFSGKLKFEYNLPTEFSAQDNADKLYNHFLDLCQNSPS